MIGSSEGPRRRVRRTRGRRKRTNAGPPRWVASPPRVARSRSAVDGVAHDDGGAFSGVFVDDVRRLDGANRRRSRRTESLSPRRRSARPDTSPRPPHRSHNAASWRFRGTAVSVPFTPQAFVVTVHPSRGAYLAARRHPHRGRALPKMPAAGAQQSLEMTAELVEFCASGQQLVARRACGSAG